MSTLKIKEFLDKDDAQLQLELAERRRKLFDLRTQAVTEKLVKSSQVGMTRREIAKIQTVMSQRRIEKVAAK